VDQVEVGDFVMAISGDFVMATGMLGSRVLDQIMERVADVEVVLVAGVARLDA
jgi:hypothetical protein